MKVKVTDPNAEYFTVGKIYDVIRIDHDGDIWVLDDIGDEFFLYPSECIYVVEGNACPTCKGSGSV